MNDDSPVQNQSESEIELLKKTTRISLEQALSAKPALKKATTSLTGQIGEKKATGPIMGIPTHTSPIPQTIRLKRPSTSPIVINPSDITSAPTVVKMAHPRPPSSPIDETATIIKRPVPSGLSAETSRIILEVGPEIFDAQQKTTPIYPVSSLEPTPAPKTIRLKRPSAVVDVVQPEEKQAFPSDMQTAKKSETAKIELKEAECQPPSTQRKTIKIKRTDRNIIPRTVSIPRQKEPKPPVEAVISKEGQAPGVPIQDEPLPAFSILAGLAVICLVLLVYLLTAQVFGPKLLLPVPSGLF